MIVFGISGRMEQIYFLRLHPVVLNEEKTFL